MNIIVCDDDKKMLDEVSKILKKTARQRKQCVNIKKYTSAEQFLFEEEENLKAIDLVYLDIEMGKMNGIELAETLRNKGYNGEIIFLTSIRDYVFDSFKVGPLNYFLKGKYSLADFEKEFARACEKMNKNKKILRCAYRKQIICIEVEDIRWIESKGRGLVINYNQVDTFTYNEKIERIEKEFEGSYLIRCHKGYIVNIKHIKKIYKMEIEMDTGAVIPIGGMYRDKFNKSFEENLFII